jgi:hypothetical protein
MHCISGAMSFSPEGKIASSRKKIAVKTVILMVPDLCFFRSFVVSENVRKVAYELS